jgi:hypothetical protein
MVGRDLACLRNIGLAVAIQISSGWAVLPSPILERRRLRVRETLALEMPISAAMCS